MQVSPSSIFLPKVIIAKQGIIILPVIPAIPEALKKEDPLSSKLGDQPEQYSKTPFQNKTEKKKKIE